MTLNQSIIEAHVLACKLDNISTYLVDEAKESLKRIKEVCNGNATRGDSKCISDDIPTSKTTS